MRKKLIFVGFIFIILITLGCNSKKDYGYISRITVADLISKFNEELANDNELEAMEISEYYSEDNLYWYNLTNGAFLVITPEKFIDNKEKEIVEISRLYIETEVNEEILLYLKDLIKANNEELTEEEIEDLITSSKEFSEKSLTANNGKGISIGYLEMDDHYEYQIIRNYK